MQLNTLNQYNNITAVVMKRHRRVVENTRRDRVRNGKSREQLEIFGKKVLS